jgi:hypothetical protein
MKTCFRCGQTKSLYEFYRHPKMADGVLNKCIECTKRDNAENNRKAAARRREATLRHPRGA